MKRSVSLIGVLALLVLLAPLASAQETRGSIEGVVKDSSGAVLPGVGRTKIKRMPTNRTAMKRFISTPFLTRTPPGSVGSPAAHAGI